MREINFITSNENKVKEFKQVLEPEIKVNHLFIEYPEPRSDYPEEIAKLAVKPLADIFNKAVVIEDSGLFIKALNGFPGTCSAYIHKRIGLNGILKLMEGVKNRKAFYKCAIGYCEPGKEPVVFVGSEEGEIATSIRGNYGFGHDPIFIPKGYDKTYGEMENVREVKKFRRIALLKLKKFLEKGDKN